MEVGISLFLSIELSQHKVQCADWKLRESLGAELGQCYAASGDASIAGVPVVTLLDDGDTLSLDSLPG